MELLVGQQNSKLKKMMTKQMTGKRDDTPLHSAARAGDFDFVNEILSETNDGELIELLSKQNQAGETALFVASEYGYVDMVKDMIKHHDAKTAAIKAKNGYDALHIAAKQGNADVVKELLKAIPELTMTADLSNTTALHSAATQGHTRVVNLLLEADQNLAKISRSNGKTPLHSAARNGHLEVARALLDREAGIATRNDKKGQTALHMAAKGQNLELVEELIKRECSLINLVDAKGNSALHIASRKARDKIVKKLLEMEEIDVGVINRSGETALDVAEKTGNASIVTILVEHGVQNATAIRPLNPARKLKQTVSEIKHDVHSQLQHTRRTRRRVQDLAKRINKLHAIGLNNAINSTTVVAVLIATVAFAAIFIVPGQYVSDDGNGLSPGLTPGEANIAGQAPFMVFFVSDSVALFISLAVVVVQTSVVVTESKAKKKMMSVINKFMWLACVLVSVAFLALSFVVVGRHERWLAEWVATIGGTIMVTTLVLMGYWVVRHRLQDKQIIRRRRSRQSSLSRSCSWSMSGLSDLDVYGDNKSFYAI